MVGFTANTGRGLIDIAARGSGGPQVATYRGVARVEGCKIPDGLIGQNGPGFGESSLGLGLGADVSAAASALAARGRRGGGGGGGGGGPKYDEAVFQGCNSGSTNSLTECAGLALQSTASCEQGERLDAFLGRQTQAIVDAVGGDAERVVRHHGETLKLSLVASWAPYRPLRSVVLTQSARLTKRSGEREQQAQADAEYVKTARKNQRIGRARDGARGELRRKSSTTHRGQLDREARTTQSADTARRLTVEAIELRIRATKAEALIEGTTTESGSTAAQGPNARPRSRRDA